MRWADGTEGGSVDGKGEEIESKVDSECGRGMGENGRRVRGFDVIHLHRK